MKTELKPKHRRFIDHYVAHGCTSPKESYQFVYEIASDATAITNASRLLRLTHVKEYLAEQLKNQQVELNITKEELINDLQFIKNTQKIKNPQAAIKAIEVLSKMMGYLAATQSEITVKGEQELFGPIDDKGILND